MVLKGCAFSKQKIGDIRLIVAPRHAEKFYYFRDKLDALGLPWTSYSDILARERGESHPIGGRITKVVLIDTMGLLRSLYSIGDLAFIGATLVNIGGHNPLEATMYGCPVCVGPFTTVVQEICDDLAHNKALETVSNGESIQRILERLLSHGNDFKEMGARGQIVWERYQGATERILQEFKSQFQSE